MSKEVVSTKFNDVEVSLETGSVAKQAHGSVMARAGETVVLATAVTSDAPREGADFFPLTVDFIEKSYSAGKIPGGFFKREARPTTDATLTARMTDRFICSKYRVPLYVSLFVSGKKTVSANHKYPSGRVEAGDTFFLCLLRGNFIFLS